MTPIGKAFWSGFRTGYCQGGIVGLTTIGLLFMGYCAGRRAERASLPSCLYINRPLQNDIKPWGCDGKEGVDVPYSEISGGGIYVSLHEWKKNCK